MYMTKTWGFGVPCGPLQFSLGGFRDRARGLLQPGDLVAIVGTFGANTPEEEHGKILGLMEPSTVVVSSLDYFDLNAVRDVDRDEQGNYRWPFGLELLAAWRFAEPRTALADVSSRQFHMDSAQGIVPLLPNEEDAILHLPREPVPLLSPFRARVRVEGADAARRRAAPPPSTTRTGVMHLRRAMEQSLLRHFDAVRRPQNREIVSPVKEDDLLAGWIRCLQATKQRRRISANCAAQPA